MRRLNALIILGSALVFLLTACGKDNKELVLDSKHKELPDYVMNTSEMIQETYIMASQYPQVLASVPCFCGCYGQDGHISNLDCYVDSLGKDNAVTEWDPMSIS